MKNAVDLENKIHSITQDRRPVCPQLPEESAETAVSQSKIYIVTKQDECIEEAGKELARYLSKTYPAMAFEVVHEQVPGRRSILLELSDHPELINSEAFLLSGRDGEFSIHGKTPRALFHGVYALLRHIGWNFYLSFEVPPTEPGPLNFQDLQISNAPLKQRRILFNWHNFISGCTGWDLEQWREWIDNGFKIGFNAIMVHAYGNNPMHSFSFNGQAKELGYLTSTRRGRDWGAQHVNDVRLLHGGRLFSTAEFGSRAALVADVERASAATQLMQDVFRHARRKAMDICFAFDVDTWMANPQNIINTLPVEALIQVGGCDTVNPEHPEARRYYKTQIEQLLSEYPEISVLTPWIRSPAEDPSILGSVWLLHTSATLPGAWREEYLNILGRLPEREDAKFYPGLFALSKLVKLFRELLYETKPDVELTLGSWCTDFMRMADPFMPANCGFVPLDALNLLKTAEASNNVRATGAHRKNYPIVWAHHDDHRYIGRPYVPYSGLNELLDGIKASGYGVIHWTTHPLDPFFNNHENQVWKNSENETWEQTVSGFSASLLKAEESNLNCYFQLWFKEAPMFGRETSDHFLVLQEDYALEGYGSSMEVVEKARARLAVLEKVDSEALNAQGLKEYRYHIGLEKFIISFFTNHHHAHSIINALKESDVGDAVSMAGKLNAEETVGIYADTIGEYGPTRGEEGLLISLNLRWLPDYIDLKQRTGLEPVRLNFQPTSHDPLAQAPGSHTFFVDENRHFWLSAGESELGFPCETNGQSPLSDVMDSWMTVVSDTTLPLKTIRGHDLAAMKYEIIVLFGAKSAGCRIQVLEDNRILSEFAKPADAQKVSNEFQAAGNQVSLKLIPQEAAVKLAGIEIRPWVVPAT